MPPRSKRKKGKYSPQRSQARAAQVSTGAPQPAPAATAPRAPQQATTPRPVVRPRAVAPSPATPMALPVSYSTISTELKTIGIMFVVMLVALIVIAVSLR